MVGDSLSWPGPYEDGAPVAQLHDRGADVAGKQPRGDYAGRLQLGPTGPPPPHCINAELNETEDSQTTARMSQVQSNRPYGRSKR